MLHWEMKIQVSKSNTRVEIPKQVERELGIQHGDPFEWEFDGELRGRYIPREERIEVIFQEFKEDKFSNDTVFWNHFDFYYPPKSWDSHLGKLPEKFQEAYNVGGISILIDWEKISQGKDFLYPEYSRPDRTKWREEFEISEKEEEANLETMQEFARSIADDLAEEISQNRDFEIFVAAYEKYVEWLHQN